MVHIYVRVGSHFKIDLAHYDWNQTLSDVFSECFPETDTSPAEERPKTHRMSFFRRLSINFWGEKVRRVDVESFWNEFCGLPPFTWIHVQTVNTHYHMMVIPNFLTQNLNWLGELHSWGDSSSCRDSQRLVHTLQHILAMIHLFKVKQQLLPHSILLIICTCWYFTQ